MTEEEKNHRLEMHNMIHRQFKSHEQMATSPVAFVAYVTALHMNFITRISKSYDQAMFAEAKALGYHLEEEA